MTSRQRIQAALEHRRPDRIPIDVGGSDSSTLTGIACNRLCQHLGLDLLPRLWDVAQQVALVDEPVRQALGGDVWGIHPQPKAWREDLLPDGSPCLLPDGFRPVRHTDGAEAVLGNEGEVVLLRRPDGLYFEPLCHSPYADALSEADFDARPEHIETFDTAPWWDMPMAQLAGQAETVRRDTDYFIIGNVYYHILAAGQSLRGFARFMMDLMIEKPLAHALMERLVDAYLRRFEQYLPVARHCDMIVVNDDLGTQAGPQMSPDLYREMIKPHHRRLYEGLKQRCGKPLLLHSCGSVYALIPDLIDIGVDALNPVQVSAADMDTARLKREFGRDITFWGGGCDTQHVLVRGSVEQVRQEVRRRVADLRGDGGFVFCPVHNIQPDVPAQNIAACYSEARAAQVNA